MYVRLFLISGGGRHFFGGVPPNLLKAPVKMIFQIYGKYEGLKQNRAQATPTITAPR